MPNTSISPFPDALLREYRSWREGGFVANRDLHERLATKGQSPSTMLVSCCDSRVDAPALFGGGPGDFFVLRNIANLIPPHEGVGEGHRHCSAAAAVEYAVTALKVAHIVVIGHSSCGGVAAAHRMCAGDAPELEKPESFIGRWVAALREPCEEVLAEGGADGPELARRLEQAAVLASLRNLRTLPFVRAALDRGALSLHGCWINIATGTLYTADDTGQFRSAV